MNADKFFAAIRNDPFNGHMTDEQVAGTNAILAGFNKFESIIPHQSFKAYMLATPAWETAHTMQPIREIGEGRGHAYGEPVGPYHKAYYGRGLVQLTWLQDYVHMQSRLAAHGIKADIVRDPDTVLQPEIAIAIMIIGMVEGAFTGKKLSDYLTDERTDFVNARRIINGLDKAETVAGYARGFNAALTAAA